ncbi:uncharacterized protein LOC118827302 [Colossoma macropomum]|uniref:uncharacterized protein LOC118827302 n=1 Tax=Colossoma macropomum TaxID=42526 RepID=UPI001865505E|nr:uncharacterized protein LOC118827302 [Colossoma macropomum]
MKSSSSALYVLILLISTFTNVSGTNSTEVKVKLNDSVTLPCYDRCSGLARWRHNSGVVVAQCNQTTCQSVKDGFEMFHDLYLEGNNSLVIPVADPSKIGEYTCRCDHETIITVQLHIESPLPVKVSLHGSATLYCYENCSGLVSWFRNRNYVPAECNQTSCRSKEGYQMIHDQYLKGNLSLIITDADFSMRGWYTCQCDGTDLRDVEFSIIALNSTVQIKPGESLVLDLEIPEQVEVLYESTGVGDSSSSPICTVDGRSSQCSGDYKQRVLFSPALELKRMNLSDSGVYTIRDARTKEVIHVYTVTVRDDPHPHRREIVLSVLELTGIVVGTASCTVIICVTYLVIVGICMKKSSQCGRGIEMNYAAGNGEDNLVSEEEDILPPDQQ